MNYEVCRQGVLLKKPDSFRLSEILECGQCFRFEKIADEDYIVIAFGRILHVYGIGEDILFENASEDDFLKVWFNYFDLERDYSEIKEEISKNDEIIQEASRYASGIRILNQDFFECMISFIISQNNRIPMIKKVIENISIKYGDYIGSFNEREYYSFPTARQLSCATEPDLMSCKTGFRAKYIIDAVNKYLNNELQWDSYFEMPGELIRENLMSVKGIGPKVADCIMFFSLGHSEVFPTDVWIRRVMSHFYFNDKDTPIKEIHNLAYTKYGRYAGFAQQYLFNYARDLKIGSK